MPDINNVVAVEGRGPFATNDYTVTTPAHDGSFALGYPPTQRALAIDLSKTTGSKVVASWCNPRTGKTSRISDLADKKRHAFEPHADGD